MKPILRAAGVVAPLVAAAVLALPAAAQAATIYPPSDSCAISPATIVPGGTLQFSCGAATFSANETVTITVTGENGAAARIAMVKFAVSTASGTTTSDADGSLKSTRIILPDNASGAYNIAAISATSAGGTSSTIIARADGGLPSTGINSSSLLGLWIGGGALVLAGGTLAVATLARRRARG